MISRASLGFVLSSVAYMVTGAFLGLYLLLAGESRDLNWVHAHLNLLGFVSMMIFGVAYHALPRFIGSPLHSDRLAELHLLAANAGLLGMVGGVVFLEGGAVTAAFAEVEAASTLLFAYNVAMTAANR